MKKVFMVMCGIQVLNLVGSDQAQNKEAFSKKLTINTAEENNAENVGKILYEYMDEFAKIHIDVFKKNLLKHVSKEEMELLMNVFDKKKREEATKLTSSFDFNRNTWIAAINAGYAFTRGAAFARMARHQRAHDDDFVKISDEVVNFYIVNFRFKGYQMGINDKIDSTECDIPEVDEDQIEIVEQKNDEPLDKE